MSKDRFTKQKAPKGIKRIPAPLGTRVLATPVNYKAEEEKVGDIYIPETVSTQAQSGEWARVVDVGPDVSDNIEIGDLVVATNQFNLVNIQIDYARYYLIDEKEVIMKLVEVEVEVEA